MVFIFLNDKIFSRSLMRFVDMYRTGVPFIDLNIGGLLHARQCNQTKSDINEFKKKNLNSMELHFRF